MPADTNIVEADETKTPPTVKPTAKPTDKQTDNDIIEISDDDKPKEPDTDTNTNSDAYELKGAVKMGHSQYQCTKHNQAGMLSPLKVHEFKLLPTENYEMIKKFVAEELGDINVEDVCDLDLRIEKGGGFSGGCPWCFADYTDLLQSCSNVWLPKWEKLSNALDSLDGKKKSTAGGEVFYYVASSWISTVQKYLKDNCNLVLKQVRSEETSGAIT